VCWSGCRARSPAPARGRGSSADCVGRADVVGDHHYWWPGAATPGSAFPSRSRSPGPGRSSEVVDPLGQVTRRRRPAAPVRPRTSLGCSSCAASCAGQHVLADGVYQLGRRHQRPPRVSRRVRPPPLAPRSDPCHSVSSSRPAPPLASTSTPVRERAAPPAAPSGRPGRPATPGETPQPRHRPHPSTRGFGPASPRARHRRRGLRRGGSSVTSPRWAVLAPLEKHGEHSSLRAAKPPSRRRAGSSTRHRLARPP